MKPTMLTYKMFAALILSLLFSACGQIETEKKAPLGGALTLSGQTMTLSAADFQTACTAKGGIISNDTCFATLRYVDIGSGTASYEEKLLINATQGARVISQGSGSVEVYVGNTRISGVPGNVNLPTSGDVKYRFSPGSYSSVKIWVVQCYNQGMGVTNCP